MKHGIKQGSVVMESMSDGDRTVTRATLYAYPHGDIVVTASSSRDPGDKSDRKVGEALAMARALRKVAAKLEKRANGMMRHHEEIERHHEEIVRIGRLKKIVYDPAEGLEAAELPEPGKETKKRRWNW